MREGRGTLCRDRDGVEGDIRRGRDGIVRGYLDRKGWVGTGTY